MSNFNEQLPEWNAQGAEPLQDKKDNGWSPEEKPPADWFNWLFNRIFKCIEEIRNFLNDLAGAERTVETVKGNADNIAALADNIVGLGDDFTAHEVKIMPHFVKDLDTNKTYRYGLQIQGGITQFIYEEVI